MGAPGDLRGGVGGKMTPQKTPSVAGSHAEDQENITVPDVFPGESAAKCAAMDEGGAHGALVLLLRDGEVFAGLASEAR